MLTQLTISNFGLIEQVSLELNERLNILTGETGAGKSILIDALRIALGDRVSTSQIRDPRGPCVIEAVFDLSNTELKGSEVLSDYMTDDDATLIVQRSITADGKNKIKVNGATVTVGQLKDIGNHLIDFHGPHDHQMLLSSDSHLGMLDRLVDFESALKDYHKIFQEYAQVQGQYNDLQSLSATRERELDLISHQVKELEQVSLDEARYAELVSEEVRINNAQRLNEYIGQLTGLLEGDGEGVSDKIRQAFSPLRSLNQIDEATLPWTEQLSQIQELNSDFLKNLQAYAEGLAFDEDHAKEVSRRFDIYEDIKRKYGPTLEQAQKFCQEIKSKHELLINFEHNDGELRKRLDDLRRKLKLVAGKITERRQKAAGSLKKVIEKELTELGIPHVRFDCRIEPAEFSIHGQDQVTFYISPNAGEDLKPLADIVSSGEAARVMLALKKALIKVDPVPVLIFDEIDAQIGGRLGTIIGEKLREISKNRQVILITHLPQIASFGDCHFMVTKAVKNNRAVTQVNLLTEDARIKELAKMMSGEKESQIAVKHAHDMLAHARK